MKKIFALSLVLIGMLFFCACEKEMIQPDSQQEDISALKGAKKHFVPFKATFVQSETWGDYSSYPVVDLIMEGEGPASHLGKTTLLVNQHWDFSIGKGPGTVFFTAANGDILEADLNAHITFTEFDDSGFPVVGKVWGSGKFIGGTGRFKDATGTYFLTAIHNISLNEGTANYTGKIMY